jgi:Uma2 family endonuclease
MTGGTGLMDVPRRLTYHDFMRLPDDGVRRELLDGEIVVTPAPNTSHQRASRAIFRALDAFVSARGLGEVFYAPFDIVLSDVDVVEPDLFVVAGDQLGIISPRQIRGAPALVVEITSAATRRRDAREKRALYERAGVREYWLVDPARHAVVVHRRDETGTWGAVTIAAGGSLTTPLLPGLVLKAELIFAE